MLDKSLVKWICAAHITLPQAMVPPMRDWAISITLLEHKDGELIMAISPDMPGLVVHGYSIDEVVNRVPGIITDLLAVDGVEVGEIELIEDKSSRNSDFGPPAYIAKAALTSRVGCD